VGPVEGRVTEMHLATPTRKKINKRKSGQKAKKDDQASPKKKIRFA
jgi:hypothetical protein